MQYFTDCRPLNDYFLAMSQSGSQRCAYLLLIEDFARARSARSKVKIETSVFEM